VLLAGFADFPRARRRASDASSSSCGARAEVTGNSSVGSFVGASVYTLARTAYARAHLLGIYASRAQIIVREHIDGRVLFVPHARSLRPRPRNDSPLVPRSGAHC